jgi:xenotropic and polytropic retrovirus receptor 1
MESYISLNSIGFRKIIKKYDKQTLSTTQDTFMSHIDGQPFVNSKKKFEMLKTDIEILFAEYFCAGSRHDARNLLRQIQKSHVKLELFTCGLLLGLSIGLWFFISISIATSSQSITRVDSIFLLFRLPFFPISMLWAFGVNVMGFRYFKINYPFIFEHLPNQYLTHSEIFHMASIFTFLYTLFLSVFTFVVFVENITSFDPAWYPVIMNSFFLFVLINPFDFFYRRTRFWLFQSLSRLLRSGFLHVKFGDFFFADQLTSLVVILYDVEFYFCFTFVDVYSDTETCRSGNKYARPILAAIPSIWRFCQCIRKHMSKVGKRNGKNAAKYASTFPLIICSSLYGNYKTNWALVLFILTGNNY